MSNRRKPAEVQHRLGNPGKRPAPKVVEIVPPPEPDTFAVPDLLDGEGGAAWELIVEGARPWLAAADLPLMLLVADGFSRRSRLSEILAAEGLVLVTEKGYRYAHPAVGMIASLEKQLGQWLSLLGLTPTDRGRLGLTLAKDEATQLELLRAVARSRRTKGT